jgi:O-antigen/teichoic acid export membrane protein
MADRVFKHSKRWYFWASLIVKIIGYFLSVFPAFIICLIEFPLLVSNDSDSTLSGLAVAVMLIALVPCLRVIFNALKNNTRLLPAIVLSVISLIMLFMVACASDTRVGLMSVAITGAIGNWLAMICWKFYDVWYDLYRHCGEVYVQ